MKAINGKPITLHLNTPGGNVFEGITISNAIRNYKADVAVEIDGMAASIGSIIAIAGNSVNIAKNGFMMIHRAQGLTIGGADNMRKQADVLDKIDGVMAKTYADKSGESEKNMLALMGDETWFTGDEAVAIGLADTVGGESGEEALFDLSKFINIPDGLECKPEKQIEAEGKRDTEKVLRDVGFSKKEAVGIASHGVEGYKEIKQREAVDKNEASVMDAIHNFSVNNLISKLRS